MMLTGQTEVLPDIEIPSGPELPNAISELKKELNAVLLAHYYQESGIQDIADFIGDSLELSRRAASTSADVIVFAGVHFMAETAKILSPEKQVLLPDLDAGCSLAEGCPAPLFKAFREKHPDHVAITYINCSAEVKALSDIICTSSSAERIINQIPGEKPILFSPDRNLGRYLVRKTGREMLLWDAACIVHETFSIFRLNIRMRTSSHTLSVRSRCSRRRISLARRVPFWDMSAKERGRSLSLQLRQASSIR